MLLAQDFLNFLNDPGSAAIVLGILAGIILGSIVLITIASVQRTRIREDAALKTRMVERGMSAEEIEKVLKAKSEKYG